MPSINSARYAQRIIQTESHESPSFLRKVHRLDPPESYIGRRVVGPMGDIRVCIISIHCHTLVYWILEEQHIGMVQIGIDYHALELNPALTLCRC